MADMTANLAAPDIPMRHCCRRPHQTLEFDFDERETARIVDRLMSFGITDIVEGVGGTGVVATLKRGTGTQIIALRSDLDARRIFGVKSLRCRSGPGSMPPPRA